MNLSRCHERRVPFCGARSEVPAIVRLHECARTRITSNCGTILKQPLTIFPTHVCVCARNMCCQWHCGLAKQEFTPAGRGFNESLTMLMGSERHFTQTNGGPNHTMHVDLWHTDAPAVGMNGTYSANLFGGYAVDAIHTHHAVRPNTPLFMYLAFTVTHSPEEAPDQVSQVKCIRCDCVCVCEKWARLRTRMFSLFVHHVLPGHMYM
jgi:hypothetical protein